MITLTDMRKTTLGMGIALTTIFLAACHSTPHVAPVQIDPAVTPLFGDTPILTVGDATQTEGAALKSLFSDATETLQSDTFQDNMVAVEGVAECCWLSKKDRIASPPRVADIIRLSDTTQPYLGWAPMTIDLVGKAQKTDAGYQGNSDAKIRFSGLKPVRGRDVFTQTTLNLGRVHLARYQDGNQVERSCAINTMAHEIAHSLSDQPYQFNWHIKDKEGWFSPKPKKMRYASYRIGTIAQCSWLQDQGRIEPSDLAACITMFEGKRFLSGACDDHEDGADMFPE